MKKIIYLNLFVFFTIFSVFGQDNATKQILPYFTFKKGLGITAPDSLYQVNIRFRMQSRMTGFKNEDENFAYDGQIRRLRLRFDGFLLNPKFLYGIQLSFAPGDVGETKVGENLNVIRDAFVAYKPTKSLSFIFGQTKLPGNRQRVNSSGALQLTDRTINNARFTIDRDFGFQVHYIKDRKEKFSYSLKGAFSGGEGRNSTQKADDGVSLTGKLELFPLGVFEKDGTYFEGDIVREKKPKLMLSGAFNQNNHARRTNGQLGDFLFEKRTMKSVLLDAMFKYNGWAAMSSYMSRTANDPITYSTDGTKSNYVFTGSGFDYQLSYMTKSKYEFIGRFSTQKAHRDIEQLTPNTKEYSLGLTKYIWDHNVKLQTEFNYDTLNYYNGDTKGNWYIRFQIEVGI